MVSLFFVPTNKYFCLMEEIRNKVKESGLIAMDLGDFKPTETIVEIDLANQLWQGLALKEKDFRTWIKENDWSQFENTAVYIHCSADAIIPTWAFMLVVSELTKIGSTFVIGDKNDLIQRLIQNNIDAINLEEYQDGRIIIKGCADIPSPEIAMSNLLAKLQPVAKSIMYGEPCSTVPVFKKPRK